MPANYPGLGELLYLSIGILSSLLLFASVLIHELAHSIVAKRNHLKIRRISLFLLGGVSEMEEEPQNPRLELKMSAAGPVASAVITVVVALLWQLSVLFRLPVIVQAPLQYTTLINAIVAVFNLLPAFPMDGGRIFRSLLWMKRKDMLQATRSAASLGKWIAYALIGIGIFIGFTVDIITGFWFILIGWLVSSGAQSGLNQTIIRQDLADLKVGQVMTSRLDSVSPEMTLQELSDEFFRLKHNGFPVLSGQDLVGCVTTDDLGKADKNLWTNTLVSQAMIPRDRILTVKPDAAVLNAISTMNDNRVGRLFVLDDQGKLAGVITRSDIMKTIRMREGASAGGMGRTFGVSQGMFFILEQPVVSGKDWIAAYNPEEVSLAGEKADGEIKQFTFQALKTGTHKIKLSDSEKTVEYAIVVST
ncbi:MAG: site-2 protease family protein [Nitrososphaerales archaeon]